MPPREKSGRLKDEEGGGNYQTSGSIKFTTLRKMIEIRRKRFLNRICLECVNGRHPDCEYSKTCPCICNEDDFPLNLKVKHGSSKGL